MVAITALPGLLRNDRLDADSVIQANGTRLLIPRRPADPYPVRLTDSLCHWAKHAPDRTFMARRDESGAWLQLTYAQALERVRAIGTNLLRLPLSAERPVMILSGNGLEHQLLGLAAMYVGVPYAPVSIAYTLVDQSYGKLRQVAQLLTAGLVAAFGDPRYVDAITAVTPADAVVLTDLNGLTGLCAVSYSSLLKTTPSGDVDEARERVTADTIAKFLLTSGSTGTPKAVITTNRMLCANQMMIRQALPFLEHEPPVLVDWLPWNHVFGGSHNVGLALTNGGSYYIDEGRPSAAGILETVRNLTEIAPTVYFNVPKGFEELLPHLQADQALRTNYLSRLRANFFAGASLAQPVWNALDAVARATVGRTVPMLTGLGATETGPSVTFTTPQLCRPGMIGLPAPGLAVKLAPVGKKLEIRVKGPNVMPGYWRRDDLTAAAFDEDGFYCLGDAVTLVESDNPAAGLSFDGRLSEDFKLSTGIWVSVGPLRMALLNALAPLVQDIVIAAPEKDHVTALILLDPSACACRFPTLAEAPTLLNCSRAAEVRAEVTTRLHAFGSSQSASSRRIVRVLLLDCGLSISAGEITDKGSINQRAVLENRRSLIDKLYSSQPDPDVLCAFDP